MGNERVYSINELKNHAPIVGVEVVTQQLEGVTKEVVKVYIQIATGVQAIEYVHISNLQRLIALKELNKPHSIAEYMKYVYTI